MVVEHCLHVENGPRGRDSVVVRSEGEFRLTWSVRLTGLLVAAAAVQLVVVVAVALAAVVTLAAAVVEG